MSEDKTYILKPKVKFTNGVNVKGYNKQFEIDGKQGTITLEAFNELFVEFSVDATREQIAEAVFESDSKLDKTLIKYYEDQGYSFDEALDMANTEQLHSIKSELFRVFSLITGETLGRKQ